jgi:hypothetical protein
VIFVDCTKSSLVVEDGACFLTMGVVGVVFDGKE